MSKINTLINNFSTNNFIAFLRDKIPSFKPDEDDLDHLFQENIYDKYESVVKIGEAKIDQDDLIVIASKTTEPLTERTGKKNQYEIAKTILKHEVKDASLFVFYDDEGNFRFSFVKANYLGTKRDFTDFKRYTYFVTPKRNNLTFRRRMELCQFESLDEIQKVFSVEALSKDFYKELSHWYFAAMSEIEFPNDINEPEAQLKANSLIRLITRLIFVWFMKQKQLVPDDLFDTEKLKNLINDKDSTGSTYYKAILQNLFFATLSTPKEAGRKFVSTQYGVQNFYRYKRFIKDETYFLELMDTVPFLNGGLFENLDIVEPENNKVLRIDCFSDNKKNEHLLKVPDYLFFGKRTADISSFYETGNYENVPVEGIIDLLNRFDFTIDENTATDQEVALDPELLGLVFENLLASYNPETQSSARKESGSFYTPRPIVDYMAEESLVQYLANETQLEQTDLRNLFKPEQELPFSIQEKQAITEALSTLKVIDPACGSGAFPMGVLLKMVQVLNHIDPENTFWRNAQLDRLKAKTFEAFDKNDIQDIKSEIDSIFNSELNDPDYARKLYLIENCIYGIDIQPIAMQIAKLRFFISLLVEQRIDNSKDNFGILALPNLETKFVAANTLIQPQKPKLDLFTNQSLLDKQEELKHCRHKLFSARTLKTKKKYRSLDKQLRDEMAELLKNTESYSHQDAAQFTQWDPYKPDTFSPWFDPEWMFGVEKFDIVIGNPPYVQLMKLQGSEIYATQNFSTFSKSTDIYCLFYERGLDILKEKGHLNYITSNSWMRTKYGKPLRILFREESNPKILVNFEDVQIFESAVVESNILLTEKDKNGNNLTAINIRSDYNSSVNLVDFIDENAVYLDVLDDNGWIVAEENVLNLKSKIEKKSKTISQLDYYIVRGFTTGCNKAFYINEDVKNTLVKDDSNAGKHIKPILRGRDLSKWSYTFNNKYSIVSVRNFEISKYKSIESHLLSFKDVLQKKTGTAKWYELQANPSVEILNSFSKPKIIWGELSDKAKFTFDDKGYCLDATVFLMTGENLKFILSIFNSKLAQWYFEQIATSSGMGTNRWKKYKIEQFPIKVTSDEIMMIFENLVDIILTKKQNNQDTTAEEQQIDIMVFKLYELSYAEVKTIDPEFNLTQDEYENYKIE